MKIAILGAESTGKSTLCHALASALNSKGIPAIAVDEYLREWCLATHRTPRPDEQENIALEQIRRCAVPDKGCTVVADTTAMMTAVYSDVLFQDRTLYDMAFRDLHSFTHILVTATDLPWEPDAHLRDSPAGQLAVHVRLQTVLRERHIPYSTIYGAGAQRLRAALQLVTPDTTVNGEWERHTRWMANCEKCSDAVCEHRMFSALTLT